MQLRSRDALADTPWLQTRKHFYDPLVPDFSVVGLSPHAYFDFCIRGDGERGLGEVELVSISNERESKDRGKWYRGGGG